MSRNKSNKRCCKIYIHNKMQNRINGNFKRPEGGREGRKDTFMNLNSQYYKDVPKLNYRFSSIPIKIWKFCFDFFNVCV